MRPSRTGGTVPYGNHTFYPAPTLTSPTSGTLVWDYEGTEPGGWDTFVSTDGGVTWLEVDNFPPYTRTATGYAAGNLWYVVGVDSLDNPLTPQSNQVPVS